MTLLAERSYLCTFDFLLIRTAVVKRLHQHEREHILKEQWVSQYCSIKYVDEPIWIESWEVVS
jgi:hypothetical protein